jgi:hypothetical protein
MTKLLLVLSLFPLTLSARPLAPLAVNMNCQAIYRTLDDALRTVEKRVALPLTRVLGGSAQYQADFEGKFFSITENLENGDLFAQITTAPDYTKGTVVRGSADSQGEFTATEVVGYTVYRMECKRP